MLDPVKNYSNSTPLEADTLDFSDLDEDYGFDEFGLDGDNYSGTQDLSGRENWSARELRQRIQQLKGQLDLGSLKPEQKQQVLTQLQDLETKINSGVFAKDSMDQMAQVADQLSQIEGKLLDLDGTEELAGGWGDDLDSDPDITPEEHLEEKYGETPTKVQQDLAFFTGNALNFQAAGEGKTLVINSATEVAITPSDKNAPVSLSEEGENILVKVGNDTFKVPRETPIRIYSDQVSGEDLGNGSGNIIVGADKSTERKFVDPAQAKALAQKIRAALDQIGRVDFGANLRDIGMNGFSGTYSGSPAPETNEPATPRYGTQGLGDTDEAKDARAVLEQLATALETSDPSAMKEAWESAQDALIRMRTETELPGYLNNKAQIVFNVLFGELGESDFKTALKSGLIPQEFTQELAAQLEVDPVETNKRSEIDGYQLGGPGWTHGSSAEFLKKYGKSA